MSRVAIGLERPAVERPGGNHWGHWVSARADAVGFKRQEDFAKAVGCTRERIVKWTAMRMPPAKMRKGFDEALARALKTDRATLFSYWHERRPGEVESIDLGDRAGWHSYEVGSPGPSQLQQRITFVAFNLPYEGLSQLWETTQLLAKRHGVAIRDNWLSDAGKPPDRKRGKKPAIK